MHHARLSDRVDQRALRRAGFTTPAVAVAMLVFMLGLALILDRLWLETAQLELMTAAEASALGAAHELASDDLLLANSAVELRINNARQTAASIASQNYVAGSPVQLNIEQDTDVQFGNLIQDSLGVRFEESDQNPTTVVITAKRTRSGNNPVGLFVGSFTGVPAGDVVARVEASISNDVVGLRPIAGTPIPAIPIAIWETDPSGQRADNWVSAIELRKGTDEYSFDSESHSVVPGSDGIPELRLHSLRLGGDPSDTNMQLLDIGNSLNAVTVTQQVKSGLSIDDLQSFNEVLYIGQGNTIDFESTPKLESGEQPEFENLVGQTRICFLYSGTVPQRQQPLATATCTRIVAIRIMAVNGYSDGACDFVVQPTVITTRTAILSSEFNEQQPANGTASLNSLTNNLMNSTSSAFQTNVLPNPYIYKLRITQ